MVNTLESDRVVRVTIVPVLPRSIVNLLLNLINFRRVACVSIQ